MDTVRENITIQGIGGGVDYINQLRADQYIENIFSQDMNLEKALIELEKARDFLGSPEHILGSMGTKHGEVAEVLEVRFGNADKIIRGEDPIYSFDGVGRTAAEDYLKNNLPVQSKFVQANLSMDAVLKHLDKYPDFVSKGGTYCIPKDYYEKIQEWAKLSPKELTNLPAADGGKLAKKVMEHIKELEEKTGKSFEEIVESSQLEYNQVQLKRAGGTIDAKETEIIEIDGERRQEYWEMAQASVKEGLKAAGISAAISGVITFVTSLITTLKSQKKKISEMTKEDWQEIFKQTGIGALKGGIQGGSIYALTNFANMNASFAAALVSATLGVATQAIRLFKGEITFDDFMYNNIDVAVEAAVSGAGAIVGQMLIPIPVLGAVVGSIVSTTVLSLVKKYIFHGGYYEAVKKAGYEKAFSDEYKPLAIAFDRSTKVFNESFTSYSQNMGEFSKRYNGNGSVGEVNLNDTLADILNS